MHLFEECARAGGVIATCFWCRVAGVRVDRMYVVDYNAKK